MAVFGKIVLDGRGGRSNVILFQMGAIVGHVDGEGFIRRFLIPREEVAPHYLVSQAAFAFEANLDVVGSTRARSLRLDCFEHELMEQVVILRSQREFFDGLTVEQDFESALNVACTFFGCEQQSP